LNALTITHRMRTRAFQKMVPYNNKLMKLTGESPMVVN